MGAFKWIGGVLGWSVGGVIGGIMGYAFGSILEHAVSGEFSATRNSGSEDDGYGSGDWKHNTRSNNWKRQQTQSGDFGISLLLLSAAVMKSDNKVLKSELDYVKDFYKKQFGQEKAENYILMLRELLNKEIDLREVCMQIKAYMDHASRVHLLHYLFGLSLSDNQTPTNEIETIKVISTWLGISTSDYESIKAMFIKDSKSAYKILEISSDATDEEVKKAYKKMAVKFHPDKVSHLGEDIQKSANEKFKEVNVAYEQIKKERGFN